VLEKILALFTGNTLWVAAFLAVLAWFYAGWSINGWRLESRYERALTDASNAVIDALKKARETEAKGETLARRQLTLEAENLKLEKERDDALRKTTSGRACFNGATVRLLNAARASGGSGVSAPARLAAGPFAAAAADSDEPETGDAASDTDVALWANYAINRYDACRGRIDALRNFYGITE
jgi:hypothetical protein